MTDNPFGRAQSGANNEINGRFLLEIDGIALASFTKLTFPRLEWGKVPNRDGADDVFMQESSGLHMSKVIRCEKNMKVNGAEDIKEILNWHLNGSSDKRTGACIMLDRDGNEKMRYSFTDAWCSMSDEVEFDATSENTPANWVFELTVSKITIE